LNSVVLSFDEKGRTPVKQYSGKKWTNESHYFTPLFTENQRDI
jgi:hypothetical protein